MFGIFITPPPFEAIKSPPVTVGYKFAKIKFHEDTIKSILSTKIESSSLPKEEKSSLLNILKGLSGKALERVITKLVDLGFENADQAIPLLKIAFESLQKSVS
ncbi:hypothetical protein [Avibacterium paragallinarum]|uniref:hypothetical protein n=1 Tax=Avibacterium paragallinarum TaxID=728 RepID=UPI000E2011DC|nr:hypothetical protein [Avibacterium paragallinarum]